MILRLLQTSIRSRNSMNDPWRKGLPAWQPYRCERLGRKRSLITSLIIYAALMEAWTPTVAETRLPPWLQDNRFRDAVVSIRVYRDDGAFAEGVGAVVSAEGYVLTSAAVLDAGQRVTVRGIDDMELSADVRFKEKESGLGILKGEGLSSNGLPLSATTPAPGIRIFSVTPGTEDGGALVAAGAIGEIETRTAREGDLDLLRHNAMIVARAYGSPVIDECGNIVAVNIPDPKAFSLFRSPRDKDPKDVVFAVSVEDVASRLANLGVAVGRADSACPSAQSRAQQRAQEAQQAQERAQQAEEEARRAGEQAQQALEQAEQSQTQIESAKEEARRSREAEEQARQESQRALQMAQQAESEVDRAETQLADARKRLAAGQRSSERLRRLIVWGSAAGALALLVILASWLAFARRRAREIAIAEARAAGAEWEAGEARRKADEKPEAAPFDCVLMGKDRSGAALALSLRRETLGSRAGAIVGRSPAGSEHVVADPDVSREHLRIHVEDGIPYAEDLNSTNGSALNGHALVPGQRSQISDGDELRLGTVFFRVHLKS